MTDILYIIIVFVIIYYILHYDLQIHGYKAITRAILFTLLSICILTYTIIEPWYNIKSNTLNLKPCKGTYDISLNPNEPCTKSSENAGVVYCECNTLLPDECETINGCSLVSNSDVFSDLWKQSKKDACKWASNHCILSQKMFNKKQQECYYYGMNMNTLLTTPSSELVSYNQICNNNLVNGSTYGNECNLFDASCSDCSNSDCIPLSKSMDQTIYSLGSGPSGEEFITDVSSNIGSFSSLVNKSTSKNKKKREKGCRNLRNKCNLYLNKFNTGISQCYQSQLNMQSFINIGGTSELQSNCSDYWAALQSFQPYCVDGSQCFI